MQESWRKVGEEERKRERKMREGWPREGNLRMQKFLWVCGTEITSCTKLNWRSSKFWLWVLFWINLDPPNHPSQLNLGPSFIYWSTCLVSTKFYNPHLFFFLYFLFFLLIFRIHYLIIIHFFCVYFISCYHLSFNLIKTWDT